MSALREMLYTRRRWIASVAVLLGGIYYGTQNLVIAIMGAFMGLLFGWAALLHANTIGTGRFIERRSTLLFMSVVFALVIALAFALVIADPINGPFAPSGWHGHRSDREQLRAR